MSPKLERCARLAGVATLLALTGSLIWATLDTKQHVDIYFESNDAPNILREYVAAQAQYGRTHRRFASVPDLLTAGVLREYGLGHPGWSDGFVYDGYHFRFQLAADGRSFTANATPDTQRAGQPPAFFIDASGKLRQSVLSPATATDLVRGSIPGLPLW
jgi:hypothetical protein